MPLQVQEIPQEGVTATKYLMMLQHQYQEKYQSQGRMVICMPNHRLHLLRRNFCVTLQAQNYHMLPQQEVFVILPPVFHLILID